jgi:pyridoxine kinase
MSLSPAPKVMAMHDLCSYGRSSLNVVTPLLAANNCHCCALPTALLSSHFGFATLPSVLDLSQELVNIYQKWDEMNLHFDAFYSGYLANSHQVSIASQFITRFQPRFIYIDPVLGDNGKLYPAFGQDQVVAMRSLLQHAHVSSPNLTEANALLNLSLDTPFDPACAKEFLRSLSDLGPSIAIVTGVPDEANNRITSYLFNKNSDQFFKIHAPLHASSPHGLHGTGDSFASIVTGRMLAYQESPQDAIALAMEYLNQAIQAAIAFQEEIAIEYPLATLIESKKRSSIEPF